MQLNLKARFAMCASCVARLMFFVLIGLSVTTVLAVAQDRPSRDGFLFSHADSDSDGLLTQGEFGHVLYPGSRKPVPQLVGKALETFRTADRDGNGRLDMAEFSAWLKQRN